MFIQRAYGRGTGFRVHVHSDRLDGGQLLERQSKIHPSGSLATSILGTQFYLTHF